MRGHRQLAIEVAEEVARARGTPRDRCSWLLRDVFRFCRRLAARALSQAVQDEASRQSLASVVLRAVELSTSPTVRNLLTVAFGFFARDLSATQILEISQYLLSFVW